MGKFSRSILQLILSPSRGWDDIAVYDESPSELLRSSFYPLLGVTAISCFAQLFYDIDYTLQRAISAALITFVEYFATYFFATGVLSFFIGNMVSEDVEAMTPEATLPSESRRTETFVIYSLSLLAIMTLLGNLLPTEISLIQILPVYVAYVMFKGSGYLSILREQTLKFILLSMAAVIMPVYILQYLFNLFL